MILLILMMIRNTIGLQNLPLQRHEKSIYYACVIFNGEQILETFFLCFLVPWEHKELLIHRITLTSLTLVSAYHILVK